MLSVERAEMNENGRTISSLNIDTNFPKKKKTNNSVKLECISLRENICII